MTHKPLYFRRAILAITALVTMPISHTLQAASSDEPVSIRLQKAIDKDCNRKPEVLSKAQSGDCIMYRIEVQNDGNSIIKQAEVKAFIPQHTALDSPLEVIQGNAIVSSNITRKTNQAGTIITKVGSIKPGKQHKIVLQYSVKVL